MTVIGALVCVASTTTVFGTVTMVEALLVKATAVSVGCGALIVTVRVPFPPCVRVSVAGRRLTTVGDGRTVKFVADCAVPAESDTEIFPVVAPLGTTAVSVVALLMVKIAVTPLKVTVCTLI